MGGKRLAHRRGGGKKVKKTFCAQRLCNIEIEINTQC